MKKFESSFVFVLLMFAETSRNVVPCEQTLANGDGNDIIILPNADETTTNK